MPNTLDSVAPTAPLLPQRKKKPLALAEITAKAMETPPNEELLDIHRQVHGLWRQHFQGNTKPESDGYLRKDVLAAHTAIAVELRERGFDHKQAPNIIKSAKKVLETTAPRGRALFARGIRMLVHSAVNGYPTDQPLVIHENGQPLGEIILNKPFPFQVSDFKTMKHLHRLDAEPIQQGKPVQVLYGFGVIVHKVYKPRAMRTHKEAC